MAFLTLKIACDSIYNLSIYLCIMRFETSFLTQVVCHGSIHNISIYLRFSHAQLWCLMHRLWHLEFVTILSIIYLFIYALWGLIYRFWHAQFAMNDSIYCLSIYFNRVNVGREQCPCDWWSAFVAANNWRWLWISSFLSPQSSWPRCSIYFNLTCIWVDLLTSWGIQSFYAMLIDDV